MIAAFVGLGKLGAPVSTAFASRGHRMLGYEKLPEKREQYRRGVSGLYEPDFDRFLLEQLQNGHLTICDTVEEAIGPAEIVFVAVPTPSLPEGNFDNEYVKTALREVADAVRSSTPAYRVIALISTVLPGTCRTEFLPLLTDLLGPPGWHGAGDRGEGWGFVYNAQFIAMGTTVDDALNPEFVLLGEVDQHSGDVMERFYAETLPSIPVCLRDGHEIQGDTESFWCHTCSGTTDEVLRVQQAPTVRTTPSNAEVIKMAYNTLLGQKIVLANAIMELCDGVPEANCDTVTGALGLATDRLISTKYLKGGMGDGGGCHIRDAAAMSYTARWLHLSADPFKFVGEARKQQTGWLADRVLRLHRDTGLPCKVLGAAYKAHTNLIDDSASLLLVGYIDDRHIPVQVYDPVAQGYQEHQGENTPHIYVIATTWPQFLDYPFVPGSHIIDPWGFLPEAPSGCTLDRVGRW